MVNFTYSSGLLSADAVVSKLPCLVTGVTIIAAAADATVILYDGLSASGTTALFKGLVKANGASIDFSPQIPVKAKIGVYLDIGGEGAACIIYTTPE